MLWIKELDRIREERRLKWAHMAKLLQISPGYMSKVKNGKQVPDSDDIAKWADLLGLKGDERNNFLLLGMKAIAPNEAMHKALIKPEETKSFSVGEERIEYISGSISIPEIGTAGASKGSYGCRYDNPERTKLPDGVASVLIYDDSGEPIVRAGQRVMIDRQRQPVENDLALVELESGFIFKRWCPQPGGELVVLASISCGQSSLAVPTNAIIAAYRVVGVLYE